MRTVLSEDWHTGSDEKPVLDYAGPPSGKRPARPLRDQVLLFWSAGVLLGCPLTIAGWWMGGGWAMLVAVILPVWAIGSLCMVVITKRRLHPSPMADQRPNRIILAFAMAELSLIASICDIGVGATYIRGAVRRYWCMENLHNGVAPAICVYAADNNNFLPPDLVTLLRMKYLKPIMLHCPEAPDAGPITVGPTTTDLDLIKTGVTDYVYLGDSTMNLKNLRNASNVPLVVEFPGNHSSGLVLFGDGHIEPRTLQELTVMMSEYLTQRRAAVGGATSRPAVP